MKVWPQVLVAPEAKRHKEYLAIFKLYTDFPRLKVARLLNHKFKRDLPEGWTFEASLVDEQWDRMRENNDDVVQRVQAWGEDYWRVRRVLKWADEDDEEHPLDGLN